MQNTSYSRERPNGGPCSHVINLKNEELLLSYELLHAYYVACIQKDAWEKKKCDCVCDEESCKTRTRIFACLSCVHFGCFNSHIHDHAVDKNHPLAIDTDFGRIFCIECKDYQYDSDFEKISRDQNLIAFHRRSTTTGATYKWEPTLEESDLLRHHKIVYNSSETSVRGLINVDNFSCYMNVVVQIFIYAPVFRDYLLSLKHKCKLTNLTGNHKMTPVCFICEMARIVQECYSGKKEPYALGYLIYLYWRRFKKSEKLGFEDSHHFFLDLLEGLHEDCEESSSSSESCQCIIHSIFGFSFQKKHTCNNCQNVNPLVETAWDINLPSPDSSDLVTASTEVCLKRALQGEIPQYLCNECSTSKGCTWKLIPEKLPHVISFCLNLPKKENRTSIKFGEFLDMSPYMLSSGNFKYKYYLFAVLGFINTDKSKEKNSEAGHYVCYIRQSMRKWVSCNDDKIETVTKEEVLKIRPRMLFYHRQFL